MFECDLQCVLPSLGVRGLVYRSPPDPMNHVKRLKGQPHQFALWELVSNWYKTYPPDHFGRVEMKQAAGLSNKTSTA